MIENAALVSSPSVQASWRFLNRVAKEARDLLHIELYEDFPDFMIGYAALPAAGKTPKGADITTAAII